MVTKLFARTYLFLLLISISIMFFWACNKTESNNINSSTSTLSYVLANGTTTTIFHAAVVKAGLDTAFNGASVFTLLVPNDPACIQSGYNQTVVDAFTPEQARKWVLYQTYAGAVLNFESFIGKTEAKLIMADGDSVFVSGDSNRTYVNGYQFLNSELTCTNGVMLALQNVLRPPTQNLEQMVSSDTSLTFFNEAVQLSSPVPDSLSAQLSTGGPFTLLAPVNDAFRSQGYNSPADLSLVSPDSLRSIVLISMVTQRLFSYDVVDSMKVQTLGDSTLFLNISGIQTTVRVLGSPYNSNIIASNAMAVNGVLFKMDSLLVR